ncbi:MAG TPA: histidine kinase [Steroidobacteraceae bacterium]
MAKLPDRESLIEARALITHLQAIGETERATLARSVHDDIAGLMVAALMDLTAASARVPVLDATTRDRLRRAHRSLVDAVDRSRKMIEELRPSLLDHVGLIAALKWRVESARREFNIDFSEWYVADEPALKPDELIALFRIAEEALGMTFRRGEVTVADLRVTVEPGSLVMELSDNGIPVEHEGKERDAKVRIAGMQHRMRVLGGSVQVEHNDFGGTHLIARLPLSK